MVLVISFRSAEDVVCMGHVVDHHDARVCAKTFATEEEAVKHVAYLNGTNERQAARFTHIFIYPDPECPEGGIKFSEVDDWELSGDAIPTHLLPQIRSSSEVAASAHKIQEQKRRDEEEQRRIDRQRSDDLRQFEHLKQKLGL